MGRDSAADVQKQRMKHVREAPHTDSASLCSYASKTIHEESNYEGGTNMKIQECIGKGRGEKRKVPPHLIACKMYMY